MVDFHLIHIIHRVWIMQSLLIVGLWIVNWNCLGCLFVLKYRVLISLLDFAGWFIVVQSFSFCLGAKYWRCMVDCCWISLDKVPWNWMQGCGFIDFEACFVIKWSFAHGIGHGFWMILWSFGYYGILSCWILLEWFMYWNEFGNWIYRCNELMWL